jgi:hypothetical protein
LRSKNLQLKKGTGLQFPEFCEAKLRKTKPHSADLCLEFHEVKLPTQIAQRFASARDSSGIFAPEGQKLERIARFFAVRSAAKNAPKPRSLIVSGNMFCPMKNPAAEQRGIFGREEKVLRTFFILHGGGLYPAIIGVGIEPPKGAGYSTPLRIIAEVIWQGT